MAKTFSSGCKCFFPNPEIIIIFARVMKFYNIFSSNKNIGSYLKWNKKWNREVCKPAILCLDWPTEFGWKTYRAQNLDWTLNLCNSFTQKNKEPLNTHALYNLLGVMESWVNSDTMLVSCREKSSCFRDNMLLKTLNKYFKNRKSQPYVPFCEKEKAFTKPIEVILISTDIFEFLILFLF